MKPTIRQEQESDAKDVFDLIRICFSNNDTGLLASMLRDRKDFIKELSIVAEIDGKIAAYILLNPIHLETKNGMLKTLWLEPVCVHPEFRGKKVACNLIKSALEKATRMGFESVFVTGEYCFYSKFGFKKAEELGIKSSLYIPPEAFLAMELKPNGLPCKGKLIYPQEIFD